jgi:hypothetical protein
MTMESPLQKAQIVCRREQSSGAKRSSQVHLVNPGETISSPDEAILKRESSIASGTPDRWRSKMNTVASTLTRGLVGTKFDTKIARTIAVFGGVALTVFSLVTSYGIDLSPGLF